MSDVDRRYADDEEMPIGFDRERKWQKQKKIFWNESLFMTQ